MSHCLLWVLYPSCVGSPDSGPMCSVALHEFHTTLGLYINICTLCSGGWCTFVSAGLVCPMWSYMGDVCVLLYLPVRVVSYMSNMSYMVLYGGVLLNPACPIWSWVEAVANPALLLKRTIRGRWCPSASIYKCDLNTSSTKQLSSFTKTHFRKSSK